MKSKSPIKKNLCVGVTGANGYLGTHICKRLEQEGMDVVLLVRNAITKNDKNNNSKNNKNNNKNNNEKTREFSLSKKYSQEEYDALLQNIDVIIHCAYDFSSSRWSKIKEYNVENTISLFRNSKRCGVRTIFISSMAAYEGCVSKYGKGKLLVERSKYVDYSIRPGLVYGDNGGMMKGLQKIANLRAIPFIKKIDHVVYPVHVDDLAAAITKCVEREITSKSRNKRNDVPITIAQKGIQFKDLLLLLSLKKSLRENPNLQKNTVQKKPFFIHIPYWIAKVGLKKLELLGIHTRFRHDSLVSLAYPNPKPKITKNAFGIKMRKFMPCEV